MSWFPARLRRVPCLPRATPPCFLPPTSVGNPTDRSCLSPFQSPLGRCARLCGLLCGVCQKMKSGLSRAAGQGAAAEGAVLVALLPLLLAYLERRPSPAARLPATSSLRLISTKSGAYLAD